MSDFDKEVELLKDDMDINMLPRTLISQSYCIFAAETKKDKNMVDTATFIRRAEEFIKANPRILEDECYPDIKKVYREHYRNIRKRV